MLEKCRKGNVVAENATLSLVIPDVSLGDAQEYAALHGCDISSSIEELTGNVEGDIITLVVVSNYNSRYLGDVRITKLERCNDSYELDIAIKPEERNKWYGSKAVMLAVKYIFMYLGGHAVWVRLRNLRMKRFFQRLGFKYKNTLFNPRVEYWVMYRGA